MGGEREGEKEGGRERGREGGRERDVVHETHCVYSRVLTYRARLDMLYRVRQERAKIA